VDFPARSSRQAEQTASDHRTQDVRHGQELVQARPNLKTDTILRL
jgi:hypothetical protein